MADARTGREHGRVKSVVDRPVKHGVPREGVFLVELADGSMVRVSGADLVPRFTSQSKDYGREW